MKKREDKFSPSHTITRRDFIAGATVALSGNLISCSWAESESPVDLKLIDMESQAPQVYYPPSCTGLRGNHPGSFEVAHQLRDGKQWDTSEVEDTAEYYDLVVVGGGISGLSAAWFYREEKPDARILILDNHDDFGGHAKRNEFWNGDQMLLSHGGTINISDFNQYGDAAKRLIRSLGIRPERYADYAQDLHSKLGLSRGIFFNKKTFGTDRLVAGEGQPSWSEFLAKTPLSEVAQKDILRLYESEEDYLAGLSLDEKRDRLRKMSYQDFLIDVAGVNLESLSIFHQNGYWAIGIDQLTAWTAVNSGDPGTQGLGFKFDGHDGVFFQFPDGNASIARLLVRSMIPEVAAGTSLEGIVAAKFDYQKLDVPASATRVRLESTVIDVRNLGKQNEAKQVEVTFVRHGQAQSVRAGRTILACYHSVIPYICKELPKVQRKALSKSLKAPLVYVSVVIRNWHAFVKLGVKRISCPDCYFDTIRLSPAINIGDYQHAKSPAEPTIVQLFRIPVSPGLPATEQWKAGRYDIYSTTFETFEKNIREQLDLILSAGGFDSTKDILAITVNRWPHGYAYGKDSETGRIAYMFDEVPPERAPWHSARHPYGRIAIANSDAAANAMTEGAIGEAHRAVQDILSV